MASWTTTARRQINWGTIPQTREKVRTESGSKHVKLIQEAKLFHPTEEVSISIVDIVIQVW